MKLKEVEVVVDFRPPHVASRKGKNKKKKLRGRKISVFKKKKKEAGEQ